MQSCFDCAYFVLDGQLNPQALMAADWNEGMATGECRRYPPKPRSATNHEGDAVSICGAFPSIIATDWCGEFTSQAKLDAG